MKLLQSTIHHRPKERRRSKDARHNGGFGVQVKPQARSDAEGFGALAYTSSPQAARVRAVTIPVRGARITKAGSRSIKEWIWLATSISVTILYCALLGLMLYLSAGTPNLGVSAIPVDGRWLVTEVVPASLGYDQNIRPGDIVLARDGKPLGASRTTEQVSFDGTRVLSIQSANSPGTIAEVKWDGGSPDSTVHQWAYSLLGLIFIAVGSAVYAKATQHTAASAFYVFCIATAVALAIALRGIAGNQIEGAAMFVTMVFWAGSFTIFFFKFPIRIGKTSRRHNMIIGTVIAGGVVIILGYLWVLSGNLNGYELVWPFYYIYLAGCVIAGLVNLGKSLAAEKSGENHQQLVLLLGGTAFAVGPIVILSLLPQLIIDRPIVQFETAAMSLGIMPLAFAYAITQHQLLGVRSLVRRGVVYLVTGSSVLLVFSIGAAALRTALPNGWDNSEVGLLSFAAFVFLIALSFQYLQRRVEHMVDRYIYHDAYDYKEALLQFSAQLAAEQNLHVLADQLVERTCRLMNLSCGVLLLTVQADDMQAWSSAATMYGKLDTARLKALDLEKTHNYTQIGRRPSETRETRPRLYMTGGLGSTEGEDGLAPYARFGNCAEWLVYGLQEELSRLGISVQQPGASIHVIHFNEANEAAALTDRNLEDSFRTQVLKAPSVTSGEARLVAEQRTSIPDTQAAEANAISSFLGVPLWTRSRFVGILCLGDKKTGERFTRDDLSLLSTLGSQSALAIYNAQLYEMREQALLDTITALAHAIEAKDNYTINHCEKITGRAVALAQSMALPRQDVENIRLGSILHDVGKIGIPDAILNKPDRLTADEYEVIKQHAAIGARIVQSVGALQGVVPIVRHHQERYDGTGYPDRLAGENIPLGARIIGVVDTYGAMTEDRIYRKAPGHDAAVAELKRFAGKQFDPAIVDAFVRLLEDQPELAEPE